MFKEEFSAMAAAASTKFGLLKKNPAGYFLLSMLAGAFIGFGVLLAFTVGGLLSGAPATKLAMGAVFGVALSLVVTAGAELFTGNTMVMTAGVVRKTVSAGNMLVLWIVCWIGNLAGAVVLGVLYHFTGLGNGAAGDFMATSALAKISAGPVELLCRGILCNILVCLAVWCGFRLKSDAGKLIMIFWCLLAFITTGFEHSIANMTLFTVALLNPCGQAVVFAGAAYNLLIVTIGNIIGGMVFVALPYAVAAREK